MGKINKIFVKIVEKIYFKIFKVKPTEDVYKFINNLGWIFLATAIAKIFMLAMNVIGGRVLGAEKYGQVNVIISVASFLLIPIFLGISGSIVKYVVEEKKINRKKAVYSTLWVFFILSLIIFTFVFFILRKYLNLLFGVTELIFIYSIILVFFWALWGFMENSMQGLFLMKKLSLVIIASNFMMFLVFLYLLLSGNTSIYLIYIPLIANYVVFFIVGLFFVKKYVMPKFESKTLMKKILPYAFWASIIMISGTFFGNIDRLMLNHFLGERSVGIYQAYYFSSIMVMGVLTGIFVKVFIPTSLHYKNKRSMFERMNKFALIMVFLILIIMPFVIWGMIKIYNYEMNYIYIILFTIATIFDSLIVIYNVLLIYLSIKSVRKSSLGMILSFMLNIGLNYLLIPLLGIAGAITATIISLVFLFTYIKMNLNRMVI